MRSFSSGMMTILTSWIRRKSTRKDMSSVPSGGTTRLMGRSAGSVNNSRVYSTCLTKSFLVLITLNRGLKARFASHRAIAKWTFPIWLYVSVTGVIVYLMLYHM